MEEREAKKKSIQLSDSNKRDIVHVKVLKPEDLAGCRSLSERMNLMVENRCQVFMHNVAFLCKKHNLTQSMLCSKKLENIISSPQLTGYKNRGRDIPISVMALIASAFDLTIEEMCGQLLDELAMSSSEQIGQPGRSMAEYMKYVGTYDLAYFDTSAPIGQNSGPTANALARAVLTVYVTYNAIGTAFFHVTAIFNCTPEERQKIVNYMNGVDCTDGVTLIREYYEQVVSGAPELRDAASRLKCLYDGEIRLTEQMTEISLRQVRGNDVVHLMMHNRAANSSDGKPYRGGLATLMSISRGAEHMPCIQSVILVRSKVRKLNQDGPRNQPVSGCALDNLQPERIARELYLTPPRIEWGGEIEKIIDYMRFLFMEGAGTSLSQLSEEDKTFCLKNFSEKKLTDVIRRNLLSYYKLSLQMDADVYALIQQIQQG